MAEYYPLLAKAVAGLPNSTPEMRRVIYERARKALLGQLRAIEPPVADADIERETRALEQAAARVEQEFGPTVVAPGAPPSAGASRPVGPKPFAPPPSPPRPAGAPPPVAAREAPAIRPWMPPPPPQPSASETSVPPAPPPPATGAARTAQDLPSAPAFVDDAAQRLRPATQRPFAPQPPEPPHGHRYLWAVAVVVGVVVVGVAIAAWKLRDRAEDVARLKTAPPQADASGSKIVDRIGGAPLAPANGQTSTPPQSATGASADSANPPLPVAYRAALLVEAPDEASKVKTYVGTAVWHVDTVSGPNQPVSAAVRADIDVPDAKLQAHIVLQKNFDASLPASHTMKITFNIDPSGPVSNVKQISVPQMRKDGSPTGEVLSGVPVPIMENSFLVGLSPGSFEAGNMASIENNQWLDVPMLLTSGRIAKLTVEKGTAGQRAMDEAVASWQGQ